MLRHLVVIHQQKGATAMSTVRPVGEIIVRAAQLARSFRERGLPVVFVNVTGAAPGRTDAGPRNLSSFPVDWTELVPELERRPNDHLVRKERVGTFIGTSLHELLAPERRNLNLSHWRCDQCRHRGDSTQRLRLRLQCCACCGCNDGPGCRRAPP